MNFLVSILLCVSTLTQTLRADINHDGAVNFSDLAILTSEWLATEPTGKCLEFDGLTSVVTVPNNSALDVDTGDFSISFWIKTTQNLANGKSVLAFGDFISDLGCGLTIASGILDFQTSTSGSIVTSEASIASGEWTHIVVVVERDEAALLYVNAGSPKNGYAIEASDDLTGNGLVIGNIGTNNRFVGSLDDIRLYKKVLSSSNISAIYNGGIGTKYTGEAAEGGAAAAAWNMDEGTGTTITDEVGDLIGTLVEGVSWANGGAGVEAAQSADIKSADRTRRNRGDRRLSE